MPDRGLTILFLAVCMHLNISISSTCFQPPHEFLTTQMMLKSDSKLSQEVIQLTKSQAEIRDGK